MKLIMNTLRYCLFIIYLITSFSTSFAQIDANKLIDGFVNYANKSADLQPSEQEKNLQRDVVKYVIFSNDKQFEVIRNDVEKIFSDPSSYGDTYKAENNIKKLNSSNRKEMSDIITYSKGGTYNVGSKEYKISMPIIGNITVEKEIGDLITGPLKPRYSLFKPKDATLLTSKEFPNTSYTYRDQVIANDLNGKQHILKIDRTCQQVQLAGFLRKAKYNYYLTLSYNDEILELKELSGNSKPEDKDFYASTDHKDIGPFTVSWDYIRYKDPSDQWLVFVKEMMLIYFRYNSIYENFNIENPSKSSINTTNNTNYKNTSVNFKAQALVKRCYFFDSPVSSTKRTSYVIRGDIVDVLQESGEYYYAIFTNSKGTKTEGYLKSNELTNDIAKFSSTTHYPINANFRADIIRPRAYFFSKPNEDSKLNNYCVRGDIVTVTKDYGNFYFISFINSSGIKSSGYMKKNELMKLK